MIGRILKTWWRGKPRRRAAAPGGLSAEPLEQRSMMAAGQLTALEVGALLDRASAATPSTNAIFAVVDRSGQILGVRTEANVVTADLNFAINGAIAKARSAVFFSSGQGILTSRTVGYLSQSTITQREVEANPTSLDESIRGPGFVAPVGVGGQFPPGIINQPLVDLFAIEHSNRVSTVVNGQLVANRKSYGQQVETNPDETSRGIGTMPGGLPVYRAGTSELIAGIGAFFPGPFGYATFEQSFQPVASQTREQRVNAPLAVESELIVFETLFVPTPLGGVPRPAIAGAPQGIINLAKISPSQPLQTQVNRINAAARINLGGIALQSFGPQPGPLGVQALFNLMKALGPGGVNGINQPVAAGGATLLDGMAQADGWIVPATNGSVLSAADVTRIINQGIAQALVTRAQIRVPTTYSRLIFVVADFNGAILGLYRMPDALCDALDVTPAKARNSVYYASSDLQPQDQLPGIPLGTAFTTRTFRYLAVPRYPSGNNNAAPGIWSILNEPGIDPKTGLNIGPPKAASSFQTVLGFDSFNPGRNFRVPFSVMPKENQNGTIFFPGSSAIYKNGQLAGGFGSSGDGVDQDDVGAFYGAVGYAAPEAKRADQFIFRGIRLPYIKFSRNVTSL
ncbi:MAG: heme-binding protein [Planctomycetia bacterium]|nr:heme-binding protein [Planctomycetia bacterium]